MDSDSDDFQADAWAFDEPSPAGAAASKGDADTVASRRPRRARTRRTGGSDAELVAELAEAAELEMVRLSFARRSWPASSSIRRPKLCKGRRV